MIDQSKTIVQIERNINSNDIKLSSTIAGSTMVDSTFKNLITSTVDYSKKIT